jgi:type IV pilus assembly protein PilW
MNAMLRSQRGYTLAEMLVVAAVVGVIMAGLFSMLSTGTQAYTVGTNRADAQQTGRLALDRLVREVRTAGHDPLATGSFSAVTALAAGTGFVLRNDWNGNGAINTTITTTVDGVAHGEQVTYTFAGTTLTRQESNIDAAAVTVATGISSMTIQYLDADDVAVATPSGANASLIRTVVLDLSTQPGTSTTGTATQVAVRSQTRVRVRNR